MHQHAYCFPGWTDKHTYQEQYILLKQYVELMSYETMVSFDIKALFTNVPIDEVLEVINQNLINDQTMGDRTALTPEQITCLLKLCLETTHFSFRGEIYQQRVGAAMGFPVSPVVASIWRWH